MARIVINFHGKDYLIDSAEGITNLYKLVKVEDRKELKEVIKQNENRILVALFLQDSDHRPLEEVAKDLGVSAGRVGMMRHQFQNMEDTSMIRNNRKKLLKKFYKI